MDILSLLEHLAENTHFCANICELLELQPDKIKKAFLSNDAVSLKNQLGDTKNLSDRSIIVQL